MGEEGDGELLEAAGGMPGARQPPQEGYMERLCSLAREALGEARE